MEKGAPLQKLLNIYNLKIEIDNDLVLDPSTKLPIFAQGQVVSGNVVYRPLSSKTVSDITLHFRGWCKTIIAAPGTLQTKRACYSEDLELCHYQYPLVKGPFQFQAGEHKFAFRFRLPTRSFQSRQPSDNRFDSNPQVLPPTIVSSGNDWHRAEVSYVFEAKVNTEGPRDSKETSLVVSLLPCWQFGGPPPNLTGETFPLKHQKPSFRQNMKNLVMGTTDKSSATPPARAVIWIQTIASVVEVMTFMLLVRPSDRADILVLHEILFVLESCTKLRVASATGDRYEELRSIAGRSIFGAASMDTSSENVYMTKALRLEDIAAGGRLVPSFKTYTISLNYELKVKVTLKSIMTGQLFNFESGIIPLQVIPLEDPTL